MSVTEPTRRTRRVHYPDSDGKPVGESDLHINLMFELLFALRRRLRDTGVNAYVAGNMFLYYQEGNPRAVVAPDVMVIPGAGTHPRRSFQVWKEGGRLPAVVIELTSRGTVKEDRDFKPALYARLGVQEYFLFDPYSEYLDPPLQGYRLVNGAYQPITGVPLVSVVLGLELRQDDRTLRLYDLRTGQRLVTTDDLDALRAEAFAAQRQAEEERAEALVAQRQAEQARLKAERERELAIERAAQLEAELARLRAERNQE